MRHVEYGQWSLKNTELLRQKVHEKGDSCVERMIFEMEDGRSPYELDFSGREALAERLGKEMASMMLEENLLGDTWRDIVEEAASWACPRCGKDSPRHKDEDGSDAYEEVVFKTKVGDVHVKLRLFRCGKCRKIFSPLPTQD